MKIHQFVCREIRGASGNVLQGIPAFRDFTIRDPRYFVILFQWKSAKKVDFRKFLTVRFLLVRFLVIVRFLVELKTILFLSISMVILAFGLQPF